MTGIFLVAIIAVISVSDLISIDSINWPAELKQSICDHRAGDLEPELHQPDILPAAALPQGRARVSVGPAIVGLDAAELIVEFCPGGAAHYAVHRQAVSSLEGPDRTGGAAAIHAIHCHGGDAALVLSQSVQPELQLLHSAAGRADAQDGAAPIQNYNRYSHRFNQREHDIKEGLHNICTVNNSRLINIFWNALNVTCHHKHRHTDTKTCV